MRRRSMHVQVAVLLFSCAAVIGAEALVEIPDHLVWPPDMKHKSTPAPGVFPGVEGEARFETNSFGIRGPEFGPKREAEYRVLVLGGSAAECFYLDQDESWPALAAARITATADGRKVWLGNAGRSGHNSRDHVMEMRLYVPHLKVDALVVMMGVNDLGVRLAQDRWHNPDFLGSEENVAYQTKHAFSVLPDDPNLPFYKKGAIGRLLGLDEDRIKAKPYQIVDNAGLVFLKWREYRKVGPAVAALPPMEAALAEYKRNAEEIARRGKEMGLRVVFVTQPAMWRDGLDGAALATLWMGGIGDFQAESGAKYYTPGALGEGLSLYNKTLLDVCARTGTECFDLAPLVPRDLTAFYDDCHFNEAGARAVADALAHWIAERPPFVKGSPAAK